MSMEETSSENPSEKPIERVIPNNNQRGLHGPSLGIGAGIAIVSIIAVFFAVSIMDNSPELQFE